MKTRIGFALATVTASLAIAAPSLADPSGQTGCGVGYGVSQANQQLGTGIGNAAHQLGFGNVGNEVIQPYHDTVKQTC